MESVSPSTGGPWELNPGCQARNQGPLPVDVSAPF